MPDNNVLIMRFHPVGGEDVSVVSDGSGGEREALGAIAQALDERRSLVLTHARYGRESGHSGGDHQPGQGGSGAGVEDRQCGDGPVPVTAGPARGRTQPPGSASGFGGQRHEENRRHLVNAGREDRRARP